MPKRKYQTPEIMHDAPLHGSKTADFHFDDFAATFARLIASPNTDTPLAIGINGAWGSGKTSLLLRVKDMLDYPKGNEGKSAHRFAEGDEKFRNCKSVWFDAWKYNDEKELLVALVRVILQAMGRDGFINKAKGWFNDPSQKSYDAIAMFINAFGVSFGGLGADFKFQLDPKKHEQISSFEKYTAFFDHFDEAFGLLLKTWCGKDGILVIFIDDLDRCLPAKTVQALEAMKLFFDKSGCVFMLGADIKIVQAAVETHYKNAGIAGEGAKDYLEKVIQLRFDLPPIVETAMEAYLHSQEKTKVDEAMLKRWQALVAAAEVNPRRVKNVINDLNLQWFMAVNSGQAEGVNRDDFICWQALMRAAPKTFVDQIMGTLEDKERRHSFIIDALKWQQGKQEDKELVKGYFSAYEDKDSKRLRGVLRQISFSNEFTPDALDSMIYMSAPPQKPEIQGEELIKEEIGKLEAYGEVGNVTLKAETAEMYVAGMSGEIRVETRSDGNRLAIGGLEFMRVPAGRFIMGSKDDNELAFDPEKPQHTIDITYDYWMAKFNVTNEQYNQYLGEKMHPVPDWQNKKDHPVVNVSWDDTMKYCQWFNQTFKSDLGEFILRLPSEGEWEKAARGAYGNEWPWGNEFAKSKCNSSEGRRGSTSSVGAYASLGGDSPYGCSDMVGNVWEWTHTLYLKYPYETNDGRENEKSRESRVIRGGAFDNFSRLTRCAFRNVDDPNDRNSSIGFRVCVLQKRRSL